MKAVVVEGRSGENRAFGVNSHSGWALTGQTNSRLNADGEISRIHEIYLV